MISFGMNCHCWTSSGTLVSRGGVFPVGRSGRREHVLLSEGRAPVKKDGPPGPPTLEHNRQAYPYTQ